MREVVATLYVLSGVLPTIALVRVWVFSQRRLKTLKRQRQAILDARAREERGPVIVDGVTVPQLTYGGVATVLVDDELVRVKDVVRDLRGPALLTFGGVVLGTVASVWSLYL